MKLKMHERSLFASLLRAPWWVSLILAAVIALGSHLALPGDFRMFGITMSAPILVIGVIAFVKQMKLPSHARMAAVQSAVLAMSWKEFSAVAEAAFVRDGFTVKRLNGGAADFEIAQELSVALVQCKRWKAANHGVAPLEELAALCKARELTDAVYISAAPLTEQAQRFAAAQNMRVINGIELALFLRDLPVSR